MKTTLFFIFLCPFFWAQDLGSDDFNTYTLGVISNDITGATAGPSGYKVTASNGPASSATSTNMSANSLQFVTYDGSTAIQITGPNNTTGAAYVWKEGLGNAWNNRDIGNNIITASVDITITGNPGSLNTFYFTIYNTDNSKHLAGARISLGDMQVRPMCYYTASTGTSANYFFNVTPAIQLTQGTTTNVSISYNRSNGRVRMLVAGHQIVDLSCSAAGSDVGKITFNVSKEANNNVEGVAIYDNLSIQATDVTLGAEDVETTEMTPMIISPNPVNNSFSITLSDSFNPAKTRVNLMDSNGKRIAQYTYSDSFDASSLPPGTYIVTVEDGSQVETLKMLKK